MTGRSTVSQTTTNSSLSSFSDSNVNPFDNSRAYVDASLTTLARPASAVLPNIRQQHMASPRSSAVRNDEILGLEQEPITDEKVWAKAHQHKNISPNRPDVLYDPEKAAYTSPRTSQRGFRSSDAASLAQPDDSISNLEGLQARNALKILLYLSGPCVALSFITMIWAFVSLLVTILYQPLRLCTPRLPFKHQLCHFLAPTLNLHLRCIYAQVFPRPVEGEELYRAFWMLAVHLVAPVLSLGNAIAAWVVALYWALAKMVGDPSGIDKKDDGVEAVLGLTRCWEACLMKGIKSQ